MTNLVQKIKAVSSDDLQKWADAMNQSLKRVSDKDWYYSRISFVVKSLQEIDSPYVLQVDWIDTRSKNGEKHYKEMISELTWGQRHSYELGILEIVSLRLNQGLNTVTSSEYWHGIRPIVRVEKKQELLDISQTHGFWYQIQEVQGEEFESR
jgi:hypothetical protein